MIYLKPRKLFQDKTLLGQYMMKIQHILSLCLFTHSLFAIDAPPIFGSTNISGGKEYTQTDYNKLEKRIKELEQENQSLRAKNRNKSACTPSYGCGLLTANAVVDWLNNINIGSLFDFSSKYVKNHSDCYVFFDFSENLSLWAEPYGFHAKYRVPSKEGIDLSLSTIGAGIGGKFSLSDRFKLGGGLGYFHSDFTNGSYKARANGFYFGPAIEYLFHKGFIALSLIGTKNYYDGNRKTQLSNEKNISLKLDSQSWDIDLRLEAEYCIEPPSDFFIPDLTFHPFVKTDFLNVIESSHHEKNGDQIKVEVASRTTSYFYSVLGSRFEKAILCYASGTLLSSLKLGWINMSPLSSSDIRWNKCSSKTKTESKNQLALGLAVLGMYQEGLLMALEYDAALGASSPIQSGRVRLEWNW